MVLGHQVLPYRQEVQVNLFLLEFLVIPEYLVIHELQRYQLVQEDQILRVVLEFRRFLLVLEDRLDPLLQVLPFLLVDLAVLVDLVSLGFRVVLVDRVVLVLLEVLVLQEVHGHLRANTIFKNNDKHFLSERFLLLSRKCVQSFTTNESDCSFDRNILSVKSQNNTEILKFEWFLFICYK